jgi:hypothetical protein
MVTQFVLRLLFALVGARPPRRRMIPVRVEDQWHELGGFGAVCIRNRQPAERL